MERAVRQLSDEKRGQTVDGRGRTSRDGRQAIAAVAVASAAISGGRGGGYSDSSGGRGSKYNDSSGGRGSEYSDSSGGRGGERRTD